MGISGGCPSATDLLSGLGQVAGPLLAPTRRAESPLQFSAEVRCLTLQWTDVDSDPGSLCSCPVTPGKLLHFSEPQFPLLTPGETTAHIVMG